MTSRVARGSAFSRIYGLIALLLALLLLTIAGISLFTDLLSKPYLAAAIAAGIGALWIARQAFRLAGDRAASPSISEGSKKREQIDLPSLSRIGVESAIASLVILALAFADAGVVYIVVAFVVAMATIVGVEVLRARRHRGS